MTPASKLTIGIVLPDDTLRVLYHPAVAGKGLEECWLKAPFAKLVASDDEFVGTTEE